MASCSCFLVSSILHSMVSGAWDRALENYKRVASKSSRSSMKASVGSRGVLESTRVGVFLDKS